MQWVAYQVAFHSVFSAAEVNLCGKGGGPKSLRLLLEGESLLNDASSITLFTIFLSQVGLRLKAHSALTTCCRLASEAFLKLSIAERADELMPLPAESTRELS
jgi:NhaP-type Na+/H+ or K+/H+ antiporter